MAQINPTQNFKKIRWKNVVVFSFLAVLLSLPVNSGYLETCYKPISQLLSDYFFLFACLGPLIAAFLVIKLWGIKYSRISFFGDKKWINIVFGTAPIISFTITGLENDFGLQSNLFALMYSSAFILYACGEEFGWRRYLQNELSPLGQWSKYLIIGVIWWLWHWRFTTNFDFLLFPLITIISSLLIGKLTDDTNSYYVAASLHGLVMILTIGSWSVNKTLGLSLTILIWLIISIYEKKHKRTTLYMKS
jgi:hypothetical protein